MSWAMMAAEQFGWELRVEEGWRKGPWTSEEDRLLIEYVKLHGEGRWNSVAKVAGLKRNGKSCRLRWVNYLRPDLKRGQITPHEERIILELHARWGNRWSTIARSLPGRTDNEIKNYWRTHFKKKANPSASGNNSEKSRAGLLRRQQFQQQQQHQQQQAQIIDMKRLMSFLDENESKVPYLPMNKQEYAENAYPSLDTTNYDQSFLYSMLNNYVTVPEATDDEDFIWDHELWNLEEVHGNTNYSFGINGTIRANCLHTPANATPFY